MSDARSLPETLGQFVADLQSKLNWHPPDDRLALPRARLIRSGDPVPEAFQRSYEALLSSATGQPYTVYLPPYRRIKDSTNGRLVCCLGANVHVLEDDGGQVTSVCYPVEQVSFIEVGRSLLYSWIRLYGQTTGGGATVTDLRFNSVTDYVLAPMVAWARPGASTSEEVDLAAERDKFSYLRQVNFKLGNYSRSSIAPGERVIQHIYQPEIRVEALRLLGLPLYKKRSNAHMIILADKELILIQDGAFNRLGRHAAYGGIWHYIPLDKIASISIAGTEDNLLTLSIAVPGHDRLDLLYSPSLRPELDQLVSRFEAMPGLLAAAGA